jgi:hypothetical protein
MRQHFPLNKHTLMLAIAAVGASATLRGQAAPAQQCPPGEVHRFDFLIGDWRGREYVLANGDSTLDDDVVAHNRKLPYGCAFEEHWEFSQGNTVAVRTAVLRSFDLASKSWRYSLVNNFVELATFESTRGDTGWLFVHDIAGATPPHRLRIQWVPTPACYTEVIQVSPDSGRTWPVVRHLNYSRVPRH